MKATAAVSSPDEIQCTLTFTMKLGEWKQIRQTLGTNSAWAEMQVITEIRDLTYQMEKTFYPNMGGDE